MKTCVCIVCGFLHEEEVGRPEDSIASGTRSADATTNRACPDCGGAKANLEVVKS